MRYKAAGLSVLVILCAVACHQGSGQYSDSEADAPTLAASLESWGLPVDLVERLGSLESLTLTGRVDSVDWISAKSARKLRHLELHNTRVRDIPALPPSLELLSIRYSPVQALGALPDSVSSLECWVTQLGEVPMAPGVRELRVHGGSGIELKQWPSGLRSLTVAGNVRFTPESPLPSSLRSLSIEGKVATLLLEKLPPELRDLELVATPAKRLPAQPLSLRSLTLQFNSSLDLVEWPSLLTQLALNQQLYPQRSPLPPTLEVLSQVGPLAENPPELPPSLRELALLRVGRSDPGEDATSDSAEANEAWLQQLPSLVGLRHLSMDGALMAGPEGPTRFPAGLRLLSIYEPPTNLPLPKELEELALYMAGPIDLSEAPLGLKRLSIESGDFGSVNPHSCQEDVAHPAINRLAPTLVALELRFARNLCLPNLAQRTTALTHLDLFGTDLHGQKLLLPDTIRHLNLGATGLDELPVLPASLESLNISSTTIADLGPLTSLANLRELTIHQGQLHDLTQVPETLVALHVVESLL